MLSWLRDFIWPLQNVLKMFFSTSFWLGVLNEYVVIVVNDLFGINKNNCRILYLTLFDSSPSDLIIFSLSLVLFPGYQVRYMYFCYCILVIIMIISIKLPEMLLLDENLFLRHLWSSNFGCASADCYGLLTISLPTSAKMSWFSYEDFQPLFNWLSLNLNSADKRASLLWVKSHVAVSGSLLSWRIFRRMGQIAESNWN